MKSNMNRGWYAASALVLAIGIASTLLVGTGSQPAAAQEAAEDRAEAFRAVEGPQQEDVPGGPLLVGAYALLWLFVLGYVWRLGRLHARTASEIEQVQRRLRED